MGWKIYFGLMVVLSVPGYIIVGFSRIWEGIDLLVTLFLIVGLFAFAWKKQILNQMFWMNVLIVSIVWNLYYHFIVPPPGAVLEVMPAGTSLMATSALNFLFFMPMFYAVYQYGFKNTNVWKVE